VKKCLKSHGDLKLAFVITKGQFELDVICAKELMGSSAKKPGTAHDVRGRLVRGLVLCTDTRIFYLNNIYFAAIYHIISAFTVKPEQTSVYMSAKTHIGNVFVTRALDL